MQVVLFYVDDNGFGIETKYVKRIVPYVHLQQIDQYKDKCFIGSLLLGEEIIPIFDFCYLIKEKRAEKNFSNRIIILENPKEFDKEKNKRIFGIIGERVQDICDIKSFEDTNAFNNLRKSFLKGIYVGEEGIIQNVNVPLLFKVLNFKPPLHP